MREALIPVDTIEMKGAWVLLIVKCKGNKFTYCDMSDQAVLSFGLEPYGSKFAVLHGEPPGRISFSCYELSHKRESVYRISKLIYTMYCELHVKWNIILIPLIKIIAYSLYAV